MVIQANVQGDFAHVVVRGSISKIDDCVEIAREVNEQIHNDVSFVVLEMTDVDFMSASFCGFLSSLVKKAHQRKVRFVLVVPKESEARSVLKTLGLDNIVNLYSTMAELSANGNLA